MIEIINLMISSGSGPEECRIAVEKLVKMIVSEASTRGIRGDVVDGPHKPGELPKSVIVTLTGEHVTPFADPYVGSVKFIFDSPVRKGHKRKNWFVGVERVVDAALREQSVDLDLKDVRFDTFRAGGPGGQHQNTTDSAVRATHIPTGLVTLARAERSQHRNRSLAVQQLADMLAVLSGDSHADAKFDVFMSHRSLERGNAVMTIKA